MAKRRRGARITLRGMRRAANGPKAMIVRPKKLLPNADNEFRTRAQAIATTIASKADVYGVSQRDVEYLCRRVKDFCEAHNRARGPATRTKGTIKDKDEQREELEALLRMHTNIIRADPKISRGNKIVLGIKERSKRLERHKAPKSRPVLRYVHGIDAGDNVPKRHVLAFEEEFAGESKRRPLGVARLDLYFEMVRPEDRDNLPTHPAEYSGWPKFLRSYSRRSPIEVIFPMPSEPMIIVYWAQWVTATGEAGPWSDICVARIEGSMKNSSCLPTVPVRREPSQQGVETRWVYIIPPLQLPGRVDGDEAATRLRRRVINEKSPRMLEAKRVAKSERLLDAA